MARRRRKKHGISGGLIAFLVILLLVLAAVGAAFLWANGEMKGKRNEAVEATFIIEKGSGSQTIAKKLQNEGIIKSAQLFRFYVKQKEVGDSLQYGEFTMKSDMTYDEIITALQKTTDDRKTVRVTFPEGITATQFAARMEEAGLCSAEEFLETANNGNFSSLKFWGLRAEKEAQFMKAEGFLFPETYDFFEGDTVYNMVQKIYAEFDKNFTDEMYTQVESMGFTLSEFITLASLVQEEAGGAVHQADVAAVFMNRMAPNSIVNKLESNTSSYITNPDDNNYLFNTVAPFYGGWDQIPQEIIDNYDTYKKEGLPVGPISNPGIDAMKNTLAYASSQYANPADPFYFFVTDLAGTYYFGRTANEHQANCEKAWAVNATLE